MTDVDADSLGSEAELHKVKAERGTPDWLGDGIRVKTDVDMRIEDIRKGIEAEVRKTQDRTPVYAESPHSNV